MRIGPVGGRFLGRFEDGLDGWRLSGDAVTNHADYEHYTGQQQIIGNVGSGFLTSFHPGAGDRATGQALSPAFTAEEDQYLVFRLAGGRGDGVGVRFLADGDAIKTWRGANSERFGWVAHPLSAVAGKSLRLELFDYETGGWGHIMLDHVLLMRLAAQKIGDGKATP